MRLTFQLGLEVAGISSNGFRRLPSLHGHTLDISATGLALVVPSIRIGEHYLAGHDHRLRVKLELPSGQVEMLLVPVRYESLEGDQAEHGYLIGARITEISDEDRKHFQDYVTKLVGKQSVV
ncbi:MAG: PilZ domain-containing protein [Pyrinomonadaceae bacterium]